MQGNRFGVYADIVNLFNANGVTARPGDLPELRRHRLQGADRRPGRPPDHVRRTLELLTLIADSAHRSPALSPSGISVASRDSARRP